MKTNFLKPFLTLSALFSTFCCASAQINSFPPVYEEKEFTINCHPKGVTVYLDGEMICADAPGTALVIVPEKVPMKKKEFKKYSSNFNSHVKILQQDALKFTFVKEGYVSKDVVVKPKITVLNEGKTTGFDYVWPSAVFCELEKESGKKSTEVYDKDPTIVEGGANERVSRDNPGKTTLEQTIIRWFFDSDPRGARIYYRVISNAPSEVKNTNETYLTTTPYEETRSFNILGLTYENSRNVTIEFKVSKRGYEDQVKRYNVRQAIDQQEIGGFFELVPKEQE